MPERHELEAAITQHKATLDRLRADGTDGPTLWAVEARLDALLEQLPRD